MADTGSATLDMINATPEERAALSRIAMLRAQGIPDDQIFAGLADPSFTQGGGAGYLPFIGEMAGINSSYNLGRGNLALSAADQAYRQTNNPYNVVGATQFMRDTGASSVLSDPSLANVAPGPAAGYQSYLDSLFNPATFPQASAAAGGVAPPSAPPAPPASPLSGLQDLAGITDPATIAALHLIDSQRRQQAATAAPTTATETGGVQTAQQGAAQLVGSGIQSSVSPQFKSTLAAGNVPGFSSINERDMGLLSPDQRANYMGLVGSTGRVSDPTAAYNNYLNIYSQR